MKITTRTLIAVAMGVICASLCWSAMGLGILPDPDRLSPQARARLAQAVAINSSVLLERGRYDLLSSSLERTLLANQEQVVSIGIRDTAGDLLVAAGPHDQAVLKYDAQVPNRDFLKVAFKTSKIESGNLELVFHSEGSPLLPKSLVGLLFVGCGSALICGLYLARVFRSTSGGGGGGVVPSRVRSALDTLAEGLLLVDDGNRIVLANRAFVSYTNQDSDALVGRSPDDFQWLDQRGRVPAERLPWNLARQKVSTEKGQILILESESRGRRNFLINAAPIEGPKQKCLGVLISFDDVTQLESKKEEMTKMLSVLRASRDEIQRTNQQLVILASSDPLTGCLNRRAFFEKFDAAWEADEQKQLGVIMIDLDHFKLINDNHGHSTGDEVLKEAARRMREVVKGIGTLARYGGEEFSVLLEGMQPDQLQETAEAIRVAIESKPVSDIQVTCSVGLALRVSNALDPQHLLDQADQCLYVAKRRGRNQVVRFDLCTREELALAEQPEEKPDHNSPVHYQAVSALLSSLAYRDRETAIHSCRVANMCVRLAQGLMPLERLYELEIAALLHDIGKMGVPDAVLLKPGRLNPEEREIMKMHDEIGVNIARAACANDNVIAIIEHHHNFFGDNASFLGEADEHLRIAMAILPICDAFDAMTNDRVYRKGMAVEAALEELRRGANSQFEPNMVHRFEKLLAADPKCIQNKQIMAGLSKPVAVHLSGLIHKLASAADVNDVKELRAISADIKRRGDDANSEVIVRAALRLEQELERTDADVANLCQIVGDVMDLCRNAREFIVDESGQTACPEPLVEPAVDAPKPS